MNDLEATHMQSSLFNWLNQTLGRLFQNILLRKLNFNLFETCPNKIQTDKRLKRIILPKHKQIFGCLSVVA